jgi:hypothetical protein
MERRAETQDETAHPAAVVDARMSLAVWLRAGRAHRGMSVDDVAKVTKIQARILERLEAGKLEGLPADVFVRGFVRSFARCVGLEEAEALRRYAACGLGAPVAPVALIGAPLTGTGGVAPAARALVEAMAELVPQSATAARATPRGMLAVEAARSPGEPVRGVEVVDLAAGSLRDLPAAGDAIRVPSASDATSLRDASQRSARGTAPTRSDPAPSAPPAVLAEPAAQDCLVEPAVAVEPAGHANSEPSRKQRRRAKARERRAARQLLVIGTPAAASPIVSAAAAGEPAMASQALGAVVLGESTELPVTAEPASFVDEPIATASWSPKMPVAAPSVPWRRPAYIPAVATALVPSLVIDDADPESAERVLEERADTHAVRRSFLPPILLDREDRSVRQGGLTLAVILLLIAATLTLSYLMRRPSASGDGMTLADEPASYVG